MEYVVDEADLGKMAVLSEITRSPLSLTARILLGTDETDDEGDVVAV